MNAIPIDDLLGTWEQLLQNGKKTSFKKISAILEKDLDTRINRTDNPPIIFDRKFHAGQKEIQQLIIQQFPEYSNLINSIPIITGYKWKIRDYIDLYFEHYGVVIEKLKRMINTECHM